MNFSCFFQKLTKTRGDVGERGQHLIWPAGHIIDIVNLYYLYDKYNIFEIDQQLISNNQKNLLVKANLLYKNYKLYIYEHKSKLNSGTNKYLNLLKNVLDLKKY